MNGTLDRFALRESGNYACGACAKRGNPGQSIAESGEEVI